jgi:hypothetical protein
MIMNSRRRNKCRPCSTWEGEDRVVGQADKGQQDQGSRRRSGHSRLGAGLTARRFLAD